MTIHLWWINSVRPFELTERSAWWFTPIIFGNVIHLCARWSLGRIDHRLAVIWRAVVGCWWRSDGCHHANIGVRFSPVVTSRDPNSRDDLSSLITLEAGNTIQPPLPLPAYLPSSTHILSLWRNSDCISGGIFPIFSFFKINVEANLSSLFNFEQFLVSNDFNWMLGFLETKRGAREIDELFVSWLARRMSCQIDMSVSHQSTEVLHVLYIHTHTHTHTYTYMYIYIYTIIYNIYIYYIYISSKINWKSETCNTFDILGQGSDSAKGRRECRWI